MREHSRRSPKVHRWSIAAVGDQALARSGYPLLLAAALAGAWGLMRAGVADFVTIATVVVASALVVWLLERTHPFTPQWTPSRRGLLLDLLHTLVSSNGVALLVRATVLTGVVMLGDYLRTVTGISVWPDQWPLVAQLLLAIVVGDFGAYWAHRIMHLTDIGWRIHAVHHSSAKLHLLASGRTHPFNTMFVFTLETGIVLLLGVPHDVLLLMSVFKAVNGLLQHANVDFRPGVLSHVMTTSAVHRWHHSEVIDESNHNFGNNTMLWDKLFGTFYLPSDRPAPRAVGITGSTIPESYLAHLATPFTLDEG